MTSARKVHRLFVTVHEPTGTSIAPWVNGSDFPDWREADMRWFARYWTFSGRSERGLSGGTVDAASDQRASRFDSGGSPSDCQDEHSEPEELDVYQAEWAAARGVNPDCQDEQR